MAYFSQEQKKRIQPFIKALLKEYGLKGSLSVKHHSTVVLTIKSGSINFLDGIDRDYVQVYKNYIERVGFKDSRSVEFLTKAVSILMAGNHDNSDIMTDYFDVGWYSNIDIGNWEHKYQLVQE